MQARLGERAAGVDGAGDPLAEAAARLERHDGGVGIVAVALLERRLEGAQARLCPFLDASLPSAGRVRVRGSGRQARHRVRVGAKGAVWLTELCSSDGATPVRGREERALEVFNESLGLYGRMQQDGRIESFDVTLLGANSVLNGCIQLKGDAAQIQAL